MDFFLLDLALAIAALLGYRLLQEPVARSAASAALADAGPASRGRSSRLEDGCYSVPRPPHRLINFW